jgi:hypothetical protein
MRKFVGLCLLCCSLRASWTLAQVPEIDPQILNRTDFDGKVTVVEVAARFVTTIQLSEAVNSVVLGDPSEFQVEHSEHEPTLVFVKAISREPAETNLLISTTNGHHVSILLVNRGEGISLERGHVDFLVGYRPSGGFLVPASGFPFAMVGETVSLERADHFSSKTPRSGQSTAGANLGTGEDPQANKGNEASRSDSQNGPLDRLLKEQEIAPLPILYGERVSDESSDGEPVRAGVSRVIDGGQQVVVLFSVLNPTKHAILLMPPQVQLGGRTNSGKLIRHKRWSAAEQLPVLDYRLSRRRVGPGQRADGVAVFERPPYKQSNETLLLQVAESGAVDRPALAPIGFGVSSSSEDPNGRGK